MVVNDLRHVSARNARMSIDWIACVARRERSLSLKILGVARGGLGECVTNDMVSAAADTELDPNAG